MGHKFVWKRLEDSESDYQSVTEIVREESVDQDGNKHNREFEIKKTDVTNERKKRDSDNLIACNLASPPLHGTLWCSRYQRYRFCRAICIENYKFPDGSTIKTYNCSKNGFKYNKIEKIPDCQPIDPSLVCEIVKGKDQLSLCVSDSSTLKCITQCKRGYRFPDGSRKMTTICTKSNGKYDPAKRIPDCIFTGDEDEGPSELIFDIEE
ncbi:uncharacterized protein LOC111633881 [Centruroides sculpturatus]|uniref:uncharacterized protein LOC111633881 n=1 Tax=Centruroides sculpturatus TaxID=218467 RepID=UPI000C6D3A32|nr:uncharacterized protein LOC111633881 [Centruroides sculpturatus]